MVDDTAKDTLIRRHAIRGTAANYAGQIITLGTGFLLTPFILRRLGPSEYGLWVLIGSVVAYGTLLDFGVWGAIVKYMAEYRARGENEQAHSLIATALWLYMLLGALAIGLSAALAPAIPFIFNIPAADRATATWLVLLSGLVLGISLPCTTAAAVLRGLQRFDLVNLLSVTGTVLGALATVAALLLGGNVLSMVAINIPIMLVMQVPSIWLINRIAPELRFGWRGGSRRLVRSIISFSSSLFVAHVANHLQSKTDEIVIGAFLPISAVTPYALAHKLSDIAQMLTEQFLKVLLPLASQLHAQNDHARLRGLYVTGTRLALAIFLPIGGALVFLARPILTIWIGVGYAEYAPLVAILICAGLINVSQWPAGSVLQGIARHWPLALMSSCAALANLALSVALVRSAGLSGVALGTLIPTAIICLGLILPYAMRVIGVGPAEALSTMFLPALLPAIPMAITLYVVQHAFAPASLLAILLVAAAGAGVYAVGYFSIGAGEVERTICRQFARESIRFAAARLRRS